MYPEGMTMSSTVQPAPVSPGLIEEYRAALDQLENAVGEVELRTASVLQPCGFPPDARQTDAAEVVSPARAMLYRLHDLTASLRIVTDRIEL